MAKKSAMMNKIGSRVDKAVKENRDKPIENNGFVELPGGIEGGIAKLVDCRFSQYKKGDLKDEWFFIARGVVTAPVSHEGIPIVGLSTMIMEPICDTERGKRQSIEEHVAYVLNEMKKLGVDTDDATGEDLESFADALMEAQPTFRFSTTSWKPDDAPPEQKPRIYHNWHGAVEMEIDTSDDVNEVDDEEEENLPFSDVKDDNTPTDKSDDLTLNELAELADGGDTDAEEQIAKAAEEAGFTEDQYGDLSSWLDVVDLINTKSPDFSENEEETAELKKGDVVQYVPPGYEGAEDMEVIAINTKRQLVTLKSLADEEEYKGVPIAALS